VFCLKIEMNLCHVETRSPKCELFFPLYCLGDISIPEMGSTPKQREQVEAFNGLASQLAAPMRRMRSSCSDLDSAPMVNASSRSSDKA
jgi:hypothetical protein